MRQIWELKQSLGHWVSIDRLTLQNEVLPIIFQAILKEILAENVDVAIEMLDSFNISNDQFKEHVVDLMLNKSLVEWLDKVPTKTKTAFTRLYNNRHVTKGIKGKAEKKKKVVLDEDEDGDGEDLYDPDWIEEKSSKKPTKESKAKTSDDEDEEGS